MNQSTLYQQKPKLSPNTTLCNFKYLLALFIRILYVIRLYPTETNLIKFKAQSFKFSVLSWTNYTKQYEKKIPFLEYFFFDDTTLSSTYSSFIIVVVYIFRLYWHFHIQEYQSRYGPTYVFSLSIISIRQLRYQEIL